jgi:hypothetical protein
MSRGPEGHEGKNGSIEERILKERREGTEVVKRGQQGQ